MPIKAVLFDADGVIQNRPGEWKDTLDRALGFEGSCAEFLLDVYAAEGPALTGGTSFVEGLSQLISKWRCRASLDEALRVWTTMACQPSILDVVRKLRQQRIRCYLASNQEVHKAAYMSQALGYGELFDREFYSCHLGRVKPSAAQITSRPSWLTSSFGLIKLLFIDDRQDNVDAANAMGMRRATFSVAAGADSLIKILGRFDIRVISNLLSPSRHKASRGRSS